MGMGKNTEEFGRLEAITMRLPDHVKPRSSTYTYSGKVLVTYHTDRDPKTKGYYNIAVVNDDGSDFKKIYSGVLLHKKANGVRYMPFQDNKRILLGHHILECTPDIDHCEKAELIPIQYPWFLQMDPRNIDVWSEVIIAPDNEHMSWTILRTDLGAANMIGVLKRMTSKYVIDNPQIISSMNYFKKDKDKKGYLLPQLMRGGEVKQFVKGGTAISLAGAKRGGTADSIVQDLKSEDMTQITLTPGYDETTMFSPDEKLGLVMSIRGSKKTNTAIFAMMPRPLGVYTTQGLIMPMYLYSVGDVRRFRTGNVGPVLINIQRSMQEESYTGIQLNDPEEQWVFCSPISWHPDGKRAMWTEILRDNNCDEENRQLRIRIVQLQDYQPQETVRAERTPDNIPYGIKNGLKLWFPPSGNVKGKIAGKHSGYAEYTRKGMVPLQGLIGFTESVYVNYSDDGKTFYHGFERMKHSVIKENCYEADLTMMGEQEGEMKLRATFSKVSLNTSTKLLFDLAEDGKTKSYGFVKYNGITLNIEDMSE